MLYFDQCFTLQLGRSYLVGSLKALIYVDFIKDVAPLAIALRQCGHQSCGYHGTRMSAHDKQATLENWRHGEIQVMVCTSAFGMGVAEDAREVRYRRTHVHVRICCYSDQSANSISSRGGYSRAASILFRACSGAATFRERRLFESGVYSVIYGIPVDMESSHRIALVRIPVDMESSHRIALVSHVWGSSLLETWSCDC